MTRARDVATQGGLVLINTTSFTGATTFSINNLFSSTYQNYKIYLTLDSASGQSVGLQLRFRSSGTDSTADYAFWYMDPNTNSTSIFAQASTGANNGWVGFQGPSGGVFDINVSRPNQAVFTHWTSFYSSNYNPGTLYGVVGMSSGIHRVASSYDGITFNAATGNFTGNIRIYGIKN